MRLQSTVSPETAVLIERGETIAVAESLTGGLVAARLVDTPGISAVFAGGVVAYSAEMKHEVLSVPREVIDTCGVVSAEVAVLMAEGVASLMGADVSVATTGVAGPGPDNGVAAGTCWIGTNEGLAYSFAFPGDRECVRAHAADLAIDILIGGRDSAEKSPFHTKTWEKPDKTGS